ncbi:unnamed protein product [Ilex paraguariensis]|uniref:Uncharacterized protein n=1 Tax=Ilex paraguariensis TaxID=185542 RepID=A0ABC8TYB2_9AQUA
MSEAPKLFTSKPKKAQLKHQQQHTSPPSASASASSMGTQATSKAPTPPPPPQLPKESFARRYKFLWPLLLTVNLAVGAYLFMRTKKKDGGTEGEESPEVPSAPVATPTVSEKSPPPLPVMAPVKLHDPIPEDQQRELYKWLLEEKRKVKPKDAEEKNRIDEEKAILKQFIRAKSIPSL